MHPDADFNDVKLKNFKIAIQLMSISRSSYGLYIT